MSFMLPDPHVNVLTALSSSALCVHHARRMYHTYFTLLTQPMVQQIDHDIQKCETRMDKYAELKNYHEKTEYEEAKAKRTSTSRHSPCIACRMYQICRMYQNCCMYHACRMHYL
jgi:hypothetical protein